MNSIASMNNDEATLITAYRVLDIPLALALRRIENELLDGDDAEPPVKAADRCCETGEGCRFGIRRLLGLT
jgi:hypothetical protein